MMNSTVVIIFIHNPHKKHPRAGTKKLIAAGVQGVQEEVEHLRLDKTGQMQQSWQNPPKRNVLVIMWYYIQSNVRDAAVSVSQKVL